MMSLQLGGYEPPSVIPDLIPNNLHSCYPCAMLISMSEFCSMTVCLMFSESPLYLQIVKVTLYKNVGSKLKKSKEKSKALYLGG